MLEEIMPNLYRLNIPLPNTPLKAINSYLVKGEGRNLIIDTGLDHKECLDAMTSSLKKLKVDLRETDIFLTHAHSDHAGLVPSLLTDTSILYCSKQDSIVFSADFSVSKYWDDLGRFTLRHGFPEKKYSTAMENNPGYKNNSWCALNHTKLSDGDTLCVGSFRFRCIETPGHTDGHMCLYEPDRKLLFSGDHILGKITPNISLVDDDKDPLGEYLQSLEKVETLDVDLVLPGHRSRITNFRKRILELKNHYAKRANEVLAALENGEKTGYQVAAEMTWDMDYESWEMFPPTQKLFAQWEALSHLNYLEKKRVIKKELIGQKVIYTLVV